MKTLAALVVALAGCASVPALVVALAGCASVPAPVVVKVPVSAPCEASVPDRPAWPTDDLTAGVDLYTFTTHAQAEIEWRDGYEGKLLAALVGCLALPPSGAPTR